MRLEEQGRSVLTALGCSPAKTDHQRESKEHSPADQAGEVCFGGFGPLSGQNQGETGTDTFDFFTALTGHRGCVCSLLFLAVSLWRLLSVRSCVWIYRFSPKILRSFPVCESTRERKEKRPTASSRVMRLPCMCV